MLKNNQEEIETLADQFQFVLSNYLNDNSRFVDKTSEVTNYITNRVPASLNKIIENNDGKYLIRGSAGKGNKTKFPWVAIMNKSHTTTTQKGVYLCYLFRSDMTGFYLALMQGATNFQEKFKGAHWVEKAKEVSDYFKTQLIDQSFNDSPEISLNSKRGERGYAYEKCTIINSSFYQSGSLSLPLMLSDLDKMLIIYDDILKHFDTYNYDEIIDRVLNTGIKSDLEPADKAVEEIKKELENSKGPQSFISQLIETTPTKPEERRFNKISTTPLKKIEYVKKVKKELENGLEGEMLCIENEKQRLIDKGYPEYADEIKHVSRQSDSYGYDVLSYDVDEQGKKYEIYIEVKTTSNQTDTKFFISKNEVEQSVKLKEKFCLFRIYDLNNKDHKPKFYKAFGDIHDHFDLNPITYEASYRFKD